MEFDILYGSGISKEGDLLDLAVNANLVEKSGSWFSYNGERIGQGREQSKEFLKSHPEILADLERMLFERAGLKGAKGANGAASPAAEAPAEESGNGEEKKRSRSSR